MTTKIAKKPRPFCPKLKAGDTLVFRGCSFDAHWEYDCPCIIYSPVRRYEIKGSSGIDGMIEDICFDLADRIPIDRGFNRSDLEEFKWRGWSPSGFRKRKNAAHYMVKVKFKKPEIGYYELDFEIVKSVTLRPHRGRQT